METIVLDNEKFNHLQRVLLIDAKDNKKEGVLIHPKHFCFLGRTYCFLARLFNKESKHLGVMGFDESIGEYEIFNHIEIVRLVKQDV